MGRTDSSCGHCLEQYSDEDDSDVFCVITCNYIQLPTLSFFFSERLSLECQHLVYVQPDCSSGTKTLQIFRSLEHALPSLPLLCSTHECLWK